ncbi:MAG: diaminopimelate decarboxylase [Oscillospiraceae bacterium]|jgi:diaminopimelate decarboxylase|nr:diaminopimelate decarboxylase [Oscillospiraceae bacterium]
MWVNDTLNVNEKGHLTIGGVDCTELAKEYGTPLYVMDEDVIVQACRSYKKSFEKYYNGKGLPLFASKAFCCKEMYRILAQEGLGADVVSGGELYTALSVGFPAENLHLHGNNKKPEEVKLALQNGVGKIVIDNFPELEMVDQIAAKLNKTAHISIRVKPGVDAHTHDFIKTGKIDSKFGFALETGEAFKAVEQALLCKNLVLDELHCHIGSQILDTEPFVTTAEIMLDFIYEIQTKFNYKITQLNLGGGFGINYKQEDNRPPFDSYMEAVSAALQAKASALNIVVPYIFIEPGRSIVGESGINLYTIGAIKEIPGIRTYVSVDGSMADNIRPALYGAEYTVVNATQAANSADFKATISGKTCETDTLQENTLIAKPAVGDILAFLSTGAYTQSMASNYNRTPRPPVIMVKDGKTRVVVKGETYEDLLKLDV